MIRRTLDTLYLWSGYVAAFFLALIGVAILAQIVGRFFRVHIEATEIASFAMAASTFFALAHTFKAGSHVRVTLFIQRLTGASLRWMEFVVCVMALLPVGYLTFYAIDLVIQSYQFNDISPGLLALPFWIPQSAMATGLVLLAIALLDEAVGILRGREPSYAANEGLLAE